MPISDTLNLCVNMWDWCPGMRIKYWRTGGQLKIISSVGLRFGPLFNLPPPEFFIQIQFTSLSFFPFRFPFPRHSFQGPYNHPSLCFPASSLGRPVLQPPLLLQSIKRHSLPARPSLRHRQPRSISRYPFSL